MKKKKRLRVLKEIRYDSGKILSNLRYIDRRKVRAATVNIDKILSLRKTETITEKTQYYMLLGILLLRW